MKCSFRQKEDGLLWGWKGPRSVYFLPFYQAVFKDNFRFLHVLRDGRDVAYGDNQMQFWMLCAKLYGEDFCNRDRVDHHRASLQFWQDVNMQAFKLATEVIYMSLEREREIHTHTTSSVHNIGVFQTSIYLYLIII
jgi:hypothetical protein